MKLESRFKKGDVVYFLDGANTNESKLIKSTVDGFEFINGFLYYIRQGNGKRMWANTCFASIDEYKDAVRQKIENSLKYIKESDKLVIDLRYMNPFNIIIDDEKIEY